MINVLIVDDSKLIRTIYASLLENDSEIEIVGYAINGIDAINKAKELNPNVILMDYQMPECNGVDATISIKSSNPKIKILILSKFNNIDLVKEVLRSGADGYIIKNLSEDSDAMAISSFVKEASANVDVFGKEITQTVLKELTQDLTQKIESKSVNNLLKRDIVILKYVRDGYTDKEISSFLKLSEGTVRNNVSKILKSLGLKNRVQLAVYVERNKVV